MFGCCWVCSRHIRVGAWFTWKVLFLFGRPLTGPFLISCGPYQDQAEADAAAQKLNQQVPSPQVIAAVAGLVQPWRPMHHAARNHSPVLLCFGQGRHVPEGFTGIQFVGRYGGPLHLWGFAAPVGVGGFADECFLGWKPLQPQSPPVPLSEKEEHHGISSW